MTSISNRILHLSGGALVSAVIVIAGSEVQSQQRPLSITDWLKAEQNNANTERARHDYERSRFGTATQQPPQPQYQPPQQAYQPQPQYQPPQQAYQPQPQYQQPTAPQPLYPQQAQAPQTIPQQQPPNPQQPQRLPQQLPQQQPPALEKIDRDMQQVTPSQFSERGYYVGGHLGWTTGTDITFESSASTVEADTSFMAFQAEGAAGYKFSNGISFELAGSYNYAEFDDTGGYASVFAVMPNAKAEFDIGQPLVPYVSGGLGLGILTAEDISAATTGSDSGIGLAYQLGFGAMYPVNLKTSLDFGYRYFGTSEVDLDLNGTEYTSEYGSHTLMLGLRHQL